MNTEVEPYLHKNPPAVIEACVDMVWTQTGQYGIHCMRSPGISILFRCFWFHAAFFIEIHNIET